MKQRAPDRTRRRKAGAQACFLPVPKNGLAEFNPVLFNYQSRPGDPGVLAILVTREGSELSAHRIEYDPRAYDPVAIAQRLAAARPDYLWDVSYLDDGIKIWQAVSEQQVPLKGAVGTSSAFCMPDFSWKLGARSIGVYAADKPDSGISQSALTPAAQDLCYEAQIGRNQCRPLDAQARKPLPLARPS